MDHCILKHLQAGLGRLVRGPENSDRRCNLLLDLSLIKAVHPARSFTPDCLEAFTIPSEELTRLGGVLSPSSTPVGFADRQGDGHGIQRIDWRVVVHPAFPLSCHRHDEIVRSMSNHHLFTVLVPCPRSGSSCVERCWLPSSGVPLRMSYRSLPLLFQTSLCFYRLPLAPFQNKAVPILALPSIAHTSSHSAEHLFALLPVCSTHPCSSKASGVAPLRMGIWHLQIQL